MMNEAVMAVGASASDWEGVRAAPSKLCIVTGELAGPDYNGGIGTANRGLAYALRARGYDVEILYTRVESGRPFAHVGTFAEQVAAFRRDGISLKCINHGGRWNDWGAKSHLAMQHLLDNAYDLVFFDDTHATAYYPLLAKRTGNERLRSVSMVVVTHSATQWIYDANQAGLSNLEEVRLMEMERRSIELADVLVSPSAYILSRYRAFGWKLPKEVVIQPNIVSEFAPTRLADDRGAIDEIVFFGRLEARKGLWLFCRCLDRIKHRIGARKVTFLGKATLEYDVSTAAKLLRRAAAWPFEIRILPGYNRDQALSYLRGGRRLAVMPSGEDNSPSVIVECLENGIPFIASSGSGGEELLSPESRAGCLFRPTAADLSTKLLDVLGRNPVPARPAFTHEDNKAAYLKLIGRILDKKVPRLDPVDLAGNPVSPPTLILVVPSNCDAGVAAEAIKATLGRYKGSARIEVLAGDPESIRERVGGNADKIGFRRFEAFHDLCRIVSQRPASLVGICLVTQALAPAWMNRASDALASGRGVAAVTGIVAEDAGEEVADLPPYFSWGPDSRRLTAAFIAGNAAALFPLALDTNSGFVAIQSRFFPILEKCSPFDPQSGRERSMRDWLHEMLTTLHAHGQSFELIPDVVVDRPSAERPSEVYGPGQFLRSLIRTQLGHAPGSEQWQLSRLAIETLLDSERLAASRQCIASVAEPALAELDWSMGPPRSTQLAQLASLALAVGQIDLAADLASSEVLPAELIGTSVRLPDYIEMAARDICLVDWVTREDFRRINLNHEWSFRLIEAERSFELHPNGANEGRATMEFPAIDLGEVNAFTTELRLSELAKPIRCRIDIAAEDLSHRMAHEIILAGGDRIVVNIPVREGVRRLCRVTIGVEMANQLDETTAGHVLWLDPRFVSNANAEPGK